MDRVVAVTGAPGGVAGEVARALADAGAQVVLAFWLGGAAADALAASHRVVPVRASLAEEGAAAVILRRARERFGRLDAVVVTLEDDGARSDRPALELELERHLLGPLLLVQAFAESGAGGDVVVVAPERPSPPAAASAGGLAGWLEASAERLAGRGVRASVVATADPAAVLARLGG
jgi:NAD(P)-dependent dehydrogenase (short-subunit alcohol dehydrogenase family)